MVLRDLGLEKEKKMRLVGKASVGKARRGSAR
jgi:hypothetical protein